MRVDRIAVVHLITELDIGGAQCALLRLLIGLDRDRFSPTVVCLYNGDKTVAQRIRQLGVHVFDLGMTAKWRWDVLWRLCTLLVRERPAILHAWMFHANFLGRIAGRLARVPIVVTSRRNVDIGGAFRESLNRWTAPLDDRVIAVCEIVRQVEIERARVPSEKVVTIYNGVDAKSFGAPDAEGRGVGRRVPGIPVGLPLVGTVGRLHRQKGFADLITAWALVRNRFPAARLLLVGDGEQRGDLEAQVRSLGLSEMVTFAGLRADISDILTELDLFVLPSLWEGMPNAVLEAMVTGLPVVATAVGGTPEVVSDGVTGLLVPPHDPTVLAQALTTLLQDPDLRRKMGQAGRKRVMQCFTAERMVERTEQLYMQLLEEKRLILTDREQAR